MKKFLFLIGIALLLTLAQMNVAFAAQSDGYIHKNHYYAVSFDGEGDAIVRTQIIIENTLQEPIERIDLEVPGQIVVYKVVQEQPMRGVIEYTKTLTSNATILNLELKESIRQNSQATIVLFYKIPRYAEKDFIGNYSFDFKTIIDKDAILIENIRVAVNVQEGLFLKGGEAEIDYRPSFGFMGEMAMTKAMDASIESPYYRDYYQGIRNAQGLVKNASNLDPFESFHVKGNYGENFLAMYFIDVVLGIIGLALLVITAGLIFKKGAKHLAIKDVKKNSFVQSTVISFFSAIAIIIFISGGFFLAEIINDISYSLTIISMLVMLMAIVASAGAMFLPPLYVSSKNGVIQGAITFFLTIFFLVGMVIALAIAFQLLFPPVFQPVRYY